MCKVYAWTRHRHSFFVLEHHYVSDKIPNSVSSICKGSNWYIMTIL